MLHSQNRNQSYIKNGLCNTVTYIIPIFSNSLIQQSSLLLACSVCSILSAKARKTAFFIPENMWGIGSDLTTIYSHCHIKRIGTRLLQQLCLIAGHFSGQSRRRDNSGRYVRQCAVGTRHLVRNSAGGRHILTHIDARNVTFALNFGGQLK